ADAARVIEINDKYGDAEFGFVDATVMAMAERLNIQTVLTVDYRDFSIFRPTHCAAFRLIYRNVFGNVKYRNPLNFNYVCGRPCGISPKWFFAAFISNTIGMLDFSTA